MKCPLPKRLVAAALSCSCLGIASYQSHMLGCAAIMMMTVRLLNPAQRIKSESFQNDLQLNRQDAKVRSGKKGEVLKLHVVSCNDH